MPAMPACDAAYFLCLTDGYLVPWWGSKPVQTALVGYVEERLPDEFGDPGQLVGANFRAGRTMGGDQVTEVRPRPNPRYRVADRGPPMRPSGRVERRYLRWRWVEPDPVPDDFTDYLFPP